MRLIIVRHGESEKNINQIVQGPNTRSDLSDNGRQQAQKLADKLKNEPIDLAFVSPMPRAQQTAEIILQYHPDTIVQTASELTERRHATKYEGGPASRIRQDWLASGLPFGEFKVEDGESWFEAGERVTSFVSGLIHQPNNSRKTILIVGHGAVFTYLLMKMDGKDTHLESKEQYDYYHPGNTAVAVIEVDETGQHQIVTLNDSSHLDEPTKN
jgi:probable phosphoglycerate mutase